MEPLLIHSIHMGNQAGVEGEIMNDMAGKIPESFCNGPFPVTWELRWPPFGGEKKPYKCLVCEG